MSETLPKLAILAGGGHAPRQVIKACQDQSRPFIVICLEGHADADLGRDLPHEVLSLGAMQRFKELCQREQVKEIVMVGRVRRPSISELKPDWLTLKIIGKIGMNALGDDGLLRSLGKALEEECGVRLIGASDVYSDLLTPEGVLTRVKPDDQSVCDYRRAAQIALKLGELDVGQAVVVQQGLVLGVEAIEGTAALIARAGTFKREGGGGVLVKRAKPQQDVRFDLPAIGPETVEQIKQAGFAGLAVEAGRSLLLDRENTIARANEAGLFIIGFKP